jgi:pyruvate formate lyase activating enzyme
MTSGRILHIQRLSTEDGPGIRTTVFFKGCPLHCSWCHNPESISTQLQTQWFAVRCIGCQTCVQVCPKGCISKTAAGFLIDQQVCDLCGECVEACPSGAREMIGRNISTDELLAELLKDRAYFEKSGGGVTLSGGEPTLQPDFAEALLSELHEAGIPTALDTCGLTSVRTLDRLLPYTDLILFDLKLLDPDLHYQFTGASNHQILDNLAYIKGYVKHQPHKIGLWIRTPLIPDATDSNQNLSGIGQFLTSYYADTVQRWELCAFNNLCRDQYSRLNLDWEYASTPLMSAEHVRQCEQVAKAAFAHPERVHATGATRVEEPNQE